MEFFAVAQHLGSHTTSKKINSSRLRAHKLLVKIQQDPKHTVDFDYIPMFVLPGFFN
jgi:hypothetical protein